MAPNFAAQQEGELPYPDLIKVQVRMDTGDVVGMEANNYWINHVTRNSLCARAHGAGSSCRSGPWAGGGDFPVRA